MYVSLNKPTLYLKTDNRRRTGNPGLMSLWKPFSLSFLKVCPQTMGGTGQRGVFHFQIAAFSNGVMCLATHTRSPELAVFLLKFFLSVSSLANSLLFPWLTRNRGLPSPFRLRKAIASHCLGETEQDPMLLPPVSSACPLSAENFSQRISLIREMRACIKQSSETKWWKCTHEA